MNIFNNSHSFIVYNGFNQGIPTKWQTFAELASCHDFIQQMGIEGNEWDITEIKTFKIWYPNLIKY